MMRILLGFIFCLLAGCASDEAVTLTDGPEQSLAEIKKAIVSVMGDPRKVSENQREFTSQYFSKKADSNFDPEKSKERVFAKMTVLGARRPYDVEIRAFVEKRVGKHYEPDGEDTATAKKLAKELKEKLNQSRDGRNVIDDFHAF
jgi:hypothetical protein